MKFGLKIFLFGALAALTVCAGTVLHRNNAKRREYLEEILPLEMLTAAIERIPAEVGNWKSVPIEFDRDSFCELNRLAGAACQKFEHFGTGEKVTATVIVGTARNVAVAIPTRPSASYRQYTMKGNNPTLVNLPGSQSCLTSELLSVTPELDDYRMTWCFSDGGEWQGPTWANRNSRDSRR